MPTIIIIIKINGKWAVISQVGYLYLVVPANIKEAVIAVRCCCLVLSGIIKGFAFHLYGKRFCLRPGGKIYLDAILWRNQVFVRILDLAGSLVGVVGVTRIVGDGRGIHTFCFWGRLRSFCQRKL